MGKKKARQRSNNKNRKKKSYQDPKSADPEGNASSGPIRHDNKIVSKLRHADTKTRQAALSALLHGNETMLLLKQKTKNQKNHHEILHAIRDQVGNYDALCSQTAAACLGKYLAAHNNSSNSADDDDGVRDADDTLSAGWLLIFLKRLQECLPKLKQHQQQQQPRSPSPAKQQKTQQPAQQKKAAPCKNRNLWLPVAEQCLFGTVQLLEGNPLVMERLVAVHQNDCYQNLLTVVTQLLQLSFSAANNDKDDDHEIWTNVQVDAARCLHSLWDDNPALILPLVEQQKHNASTGALLPVLHQILTMTEANNNNDLVTRLHCAGAWMALWTILAENHHDGDSNSKKELSLQLQQTVPICVSLLRTALQQWTDAVAKHNNTLLSNLQTCYRAYLLQQQDRQLEREVLTAQEQKQEPARHIARRLKQQQQQQQEVAAATAAANTEDDGDDAMDEDDTTAKQPSKDRLRADRSDKMAEWESAQWEWDHAVRPVQLALEIIANLTSSAETDDDDGMDSGGEVSTTATTQHILQDHIPDQLHQLLGEMSTWYSAAKKNADGCVDELPAIIAESISDLQCKVAVCLGHCLANIPEWPAMGIWKELKETTVADQAALEAMTSTMVVALRSRTCVRTQIQEDDLDHLLTMLTSSNQSTVLVRDIVCMLGILCSEEEHSVQVNERVCHALLNCSANSGPDPQHAMVLAEVLSVLMDIYGNDDCHPAIFDSMQVLGHFQKILPILKQRISMEELTKRCSPEEVEQWKETSMNAARFIEYKKGHII